MKYKTKILTPLPKHFNANSHEEAWKFIHFWVSNYVLVTESKPKEKKNA